MAVRWLKTEYVDIETGEILSRWQLENKLYKRVEIIKIKQYENGNEYRGERVLIKNLRNKEIQGTLF